jgi:hypothetical protein
LNLQGNARISKKRANEGHKTTKRDANKARRADEDYSATEQDSNRARLANEDFSSAERVANKRARKNGAQTWTMRPPNAMLLKCAIQSGLGCFCIYLYASHEPSSFSGCLFLSMAKSGPSRNPIFFKMHFTISRPQKKEKHSPVRDRLP